MPQDNGVPADAELARAQITRLREVLAELVNESPRWGPPDQIATLTLADAEADPGQHVSYLLALGHVGDLANMVAYGRQQHGAAEEVDELGERLTAVIVAERRARPDADLSAFIAAALWDAARQLSGTAGHRLTFDNHGEPHIEPYPVSEFEVGTGAARYVRGRPGSWEAALVLEWTRAGREVPRGEMTGDAGERLASLTKLFTEMGYRYMPVDGGELLSSVLGEAADQLGGLPTLLAGAEWVYEPLERLAHQYAGDGLAAGGDLPSET